MKETKYAFLAVKVILQLIVCVSYLDYLFEKRLIIPQIII